MVAVDLLALFESLVLPLEPPGETSFSGVPIPSSETHRLAKDAQGSPCLLLRQPPRAARPAPVHLQNLSVSYDVACNITHSNGVEEQGTFTIIRCSNADPKLFPHFLNIISPMVVALGPNPTSAAIRRAISGLVELFRALTAPTQKSIQGIWGELFLIHNASDPRTVAAAWHRIPEEHYDFAAGPQRLDVKTSSTRRREHHFSLPQLTAPGPSQVVIASLFVERTGGGISLRQLFEQTRHFLANDAALLTQFDASFYATIGSAWNDAMNESFDWELAGESLLFFDVASIPKVQTPVPHGVSDVRFCSDLSAVAPLQFGHLRSFGNLLAAAVR